MTEMSKELRDMMKEIHEMSDEPNLSTPGNIALETISADLEEYGNFCGIDDLTLDDETDKVTLSMLRDIEPDEWALEMEAEAMDFFGEHIQISIKDIEDLNDGTITYELTVK